MNQALTIDTFPSGKFGKEYHKEWREERKCKGLCLRCDSIPRKGKVYCDACLQVNRARNRKQYTELKRIAITIYGGKCTCCGETNLVFLTIDHIAGNGAEHRKQIGTKIYQWLKNNNYPQGIVQVLCCNCNWAKYLEGECPHQQKKNASVMETTAIM